MKCIIPKYSGFCFDVAETVKAAYSYTDGSTYMYGEIVNNPGIVNDLQSKGLKLVYDLDSIPQKDDLKVLIRAHGVPEATINDIARRGYKVIDMTCPKVKKVQMLAANASERGLDIILVGSPPDHPEVVGILGWAKTKIILVQNSDEAKAIIPNTVFTAKGVCLLAQTTHNREEYEEIKEYCATIIPNIEFHDTVCDATEKRQGEIRHLVKSCDGVIVVGGRMSSNVSKLYEIASEYCTNVQHVESAKELDLTKLNGVSRLIVVGGASTPGTSIDEIVLAVKDYCVVRKYPFDVQYLRDKISSADIEEL
jgi:4-hydroxy-3-methylbut-2-enyl diphosphate reductase